MKKINNLTGGLYSDEWHTTADVVGKVIEILRPSGVICCPFDTASSQFVQQGANHGSMLFGMRDWLERDYEYDYLMTNPPFSIKDRVIERVLKNGKPSALILPLDSIGGVRRHRLFAEYGYPSIYVPIKRFSYYDESGNRRKASNFHSVIALFNTGHSGLMFEKKLSTDDQQPVQHADE